MNSPAKVHSSVGYQLTWRDSPDINKETPELLVKFPRWITVQANTVGQNSDETDRLNGRINDLITDSQASGFCRQVNQSFGLDNAFIFTRLNSQPGFVGLRVPLPEANGHSPDWQRIEKTLGSLEILLTHLNAQTAPESVGETPQQEQLYSVEITNTDLRGSLSSELLGWLNALDTHTNLPAVEQAMQRAHQLLRGHQRGKLDDFAARTLPSSQSLLKISCFDGAREAALQFQSREMGVEEHNPAVFRSVHSISRIQQFILLSGLAMLTNITQDKQ